MSATAPELYVQPTVATHTADPRPSPRASAGATVEGTSSVDYLVQDYDGLIYVVQVKLGEDNSSAAVAAWLDAVAAAAGTPDEPVDTAEAVERQSAITAALQEGQLRSVVYQDKH